MAQLPDLPGSCWGDHCLKQSQFKLAASKQLTSTQTVAVRLNLILQTDALNVLSIDPETVLRQLDECAA